MPWFEFNVLDKGRLKSCLLSLLFFAICSLPNLGHSKAGLNNKTTFSQTVDSIQNILILHNNNNKLHLYIVNDITNSLAKTHSATRLLTSNNLLEAEEKKLSLIIAIGLDNIKKAIEKFPDKNKLFITSSPNTYQPDNNTKAKESMFYMTQSFCRQLKFISLLNEKWKKIGTLSSSKKNIDIKNLQDCAHNNHLEIVPVNITERTTLTQKVRQVVTHSDVLLALPDKEIYNSQTVKNILLTSYRYRKPVIAFSENFVKSGALASIYSRKKQITKSINLIIKNYLDSNNQFNKQINYPKEFSVTINKQVAKALNIKVPDLKTIKEKIQDLKTYDTGNTR